MYIQTEKVNIRPKSYLPVFRVSEGDVGRTLTAHLVSDDGDVTIPAGATVTMAGMKPSGLGYTVTGTIDGSDVSFDTDAVMTDEPGRIVSEIRIVQGDTVIGTTNVVLSVEPNPHPDDTTDGRREPLINEITALLESITEQADRAEAVTKAVIDMTVTAHESDEATVTKTEGEVVNLDFGLPRGETGATGPQGPQGNTGPQGPKGDPGEVSLETLAKVMVSDTASGTIATFPDGSDVLPAKSVLVTLEPKQSGSGTPSPSNVRPISGWDSVDTHKTGVNVWDEEWELGAIANGVPVSTSNSIRSKNFISCVPGTTYFVVAPRSIILWWYDYKQDYIGEHTSIAQQQKVIPANARYFKIGFPTAYGTTYNNDISINYPSTDHDYHPYDGQTITTDLPQTVYGGTLDVVSGVLTVTHGYISQYNGEAINEPWISDRDEYVSGTTPSSGAEVVYTLATPTTIQCDPQTVQTLMGDNNVWGGDGVSIDYYADTKLYIEKRLGA